MDRLTHIQAMYEDKAIVTGSPIFPIRCSLREIVHYYSMRRKLQPDETLTRGRTFTITDGLLRPLRLAVQQMQTVSDALRAVASAGKPSYRVDPGQGFLALLESALSLEELQLAWVGITNRLANAQRIYMARYDEARLAQRRQAREEHLGGRPPSGEQGLYTTQRRFSNADQVDRPSCSRTELAESARNAHQPVLSSRRPREPPDKARADCSRDSYKISRVPYYGPSYLQHTVAFKDWLDALPRNEQELDILGKCEGRAPLAPIGRGDDSGCDTGDATVSTPAKQLSSSRVEVRSLPGAGLLHLSELLRPPPTSPSPRMHTFRTSDWGSKTARRTQLTAPGCEASATAFYFMFVRRPYAEGLAKEDEIELLICWVRTKRKLEPDGRELRRHVKRAATVYCRGWRTLSGAPALMVRDYSISSKAQPAIKGCVPFTSHHPPLANEDSRPRPYVPAIATYAQLASMQKPLAQTLSRTSDTGQRECATVHTLRRESLPRDGPLEFRGEHDGELARPQRASDTNRTFRRGSLPASHCRAILLRPTNHLARLGAQAGWWKPKLQRPAGRAGATCREGSPDRREAQESPGQMFGIISIGRRATLDHLPAVTHLHKLEVDVLKPRPRVLAMTISGQPMWMPADQQPAQDFRSAGISVVCKLARGVSREFDVAERIDRGRPASLTSLRAQRVCARGRFSVERENRSPSTLCHIPCYVRCPEFAGIIPKPEGQYTAPSKVPLALKHDFAVVVSVFRSNEVRVSCSSDAGGRSERSQCTMLASRRDRGALDHGLLYVVSEHGRRSEREHAPLEFLRLELTGDFPKPVGQRASVSGHVVKARAFRVLEMKAVGETARARVREFQGDEWIHHGQGTTFASRTAVPVLECALLDNSRMCRDDAKSLPRLSNAGGRDKRIFRATSNSADAQVRPQRNYRALETGSASESFPLEFSAQGLISLDPCAASRSTGERPKLQRARGGRHCKLKPRRARYSATVVLREKSLELPGARAPSSRRFVSRAPRATHNNSSLSLQRRAIVRANSRSRTHTIAQSTGSRAASKWRTLARVKSLGRPAKGAGQNSSCTFPCSFEAGGRARQRERAMANSLREQLGRINDLADDIGNGGSRARQEHVPSGFHRPELARRSTPRRRCALETDAMGEFDSHGRSEQSRGATFASQSARRVLIHGLRHLVSDHNRGSEQEHAPVEFHRPVLTGEVPKPAGRYASASSHVAQAKGFRVLEIGEVDETGRGFAYKIEAGGRMDHSQRAIIASYAARSAPECALLDNSGTFGDDAMSPPRPCDAGGRAMRIFRATSDSAEGRLRSRRHSAILDIDAARESWNASPHDCEAVGWLGRGQFASPGGQLVSERSLINIRNNIGRRATHSPRDSSVQGVPMLITQRAIVEGYAPETITALRKTAMADIRTRGESCLARGVGECKESHLAANPAIKRLGGELPQPFVDLSESQGRESAVQAEFDARFLEQLDQLREIGPSGPTTSISRLNLILPLPTPPSHALLALRPTNHRVPRLGTSLILGRTDLSQSRAFQPHFFRSWPSLPYVALTDVGGVLGGLNSQRAPSPLSPHCELGGSWGWYPLPNARRARRARCGTYRGRLSSATGETRSKPRREEGATSVSEQRGCDSLDPEGEAKLSSGREEDVPSVMQKGASAALTRRRINPLWPWAPGRRGRDDCPHDNRVAHEWEPLPGQRGGSRRAGQVMVQRRCELVARREGEPVYGEMAGSRAR